MKSVEERLLKPADDLVEHAAKLLFPNESVPDARLNVLEAIASTYAGWSIEEYWALTRKKRPSPSSNPRSWVDKILSCIDGSLIPTPLALSSLAREVIPTGSQKKTGAYYTDWRLAQMLADASVPQVDREGLWVDPACGSGILLVAAVMASSPNKREEIIRDRLCGADLSARALRGTLLAVSSLTKRLSTVERFQRRLICGDSLRNRDTWQALAPEGFALVIGNPPWERLRTSRHETASTGGQSRHYGQSFEGEIDLSESRAEILDYLDHVVSNTKLQGKGEHDLYKLFLELGLGLAAERGIVAQLVPAGLIRSQGTETLRKELDALARDLHVFVMENRQRHFAIDSRFKFLAVIGRVGAGRRQPMMLKVADRTGSLPTNPVHISRAALRQIRPDLSVPEVRTPEEWELFSRLSQTGVRVGDPSGPWRPSYRRELDMTNDHRNFEHGQVSGAFPVIEGRHVAQYRSRAKSYRSGEGRAAIWKPEKLGRAALKPQWFIRPERLRARSLESAERSRVGFCDITGQTNERSLLVARVPPGVVCGNKVPTLTFPDGGPDREDLFVALANSFVVDWMLRRLVTTTVNFFLLDSLPFPALPIASPASGRLIELARLVARAEVAGEVDLWQVAEWRAEIDAIAAVSWGIGLDDMRLVMQDFPLLDRGQSPLNGEKNSTITADLVISTLAKALEIEVAVEPLRVQQAKLSGATPYIPAEYA